MIDNLLFREDILHRQSKYYFSGKVSISSLKTGRFIFSFDKINVVEVVPVVVEKKEKRRD